MIVSEAAVKKIGEWRATISNGALGVRMLLSYSLAVLFTVVELDKKK